jgi:endonuclease YncB( thermonuclease family)
VLPRPRFLQFLLLFVAALAFADEQVITPKHTKTFKRYDNCEFVPGRYADGDSFMVMIGQQEFMMRLYYVDAPESDERFPDRNAEQAQYFGITPPESVAAGKAAKKFVADLLDGKKFTVYTRWASALGSSKLPRHYAVIEVDGRGLADLLVENGFARLHGTKANHPSGTKADDYIATLQELETAAIAGKKGAWATSRPELRHPVAEETKETTETPRWLDRLLFGAAGAGAVGAAWTMAALKRGRVSVTTNRISEMQN